MLSSDIHYLVYSSQPYYPYPILCMRNTESQKMQITSPVSELVMEWWSQTQIPNHYATATQLPTLMAGLQLHH